MKKLSILILVLFVCMAFAVPALAKVKVGGRVDVDTMYIVNDEHFQRNSAAVAAALNSVDASRSWFTIDVPSSTRLYGKWTNDAGDVGMHIEIGLRGEEGGAERVNTRYAYGWWKINPMFKLTVGQQDEVIAPYRASQELGTNGKLGTRNDNNMDHTGLRGFGGIGNDRKEGIRLDTKLGETANLAVAIFTPNVNGAQGSWATRDEEDTLPRIDATFSVSLGSFSLAPGFSWYKVQYEWDPQSPNYNGDDADIDAWVLSLPVKFAPGGPITLTAELNYGENIGNGNWNIGRYTNIAPNNTISTGAQFDNVTDASGNVFTQVADTEFLGFWADLSWKAHPIATIHFLYGIQQLTNDDRVAQANRWDNTRFAYGVSIPIKVAKGFTIRPEIFYYDYGENEVGGVVDPANGDLGSQTIVGVQFRIAF